MNESASTRQRLIQAARDLFTRKGFDATSVREITRDADANLGAITYHFGSKQALYDAVLDDAFAPMSPVLERARITGAAAPIDRIEQLVRVFFAKLSQSPELPLLIMQQVVRHGELPAPATRMLGQVLGVLVQLIGEGQADGTIREGDPLLLAVSIWSQPFYFGLLRRLSPDRLLRTAAGVPAIETLADHVVEFVRRGLAREED